MNPQSTGSGDTPARRGRGWAVPFLGAMALALVMGLAVVLEPVHRRGSAQGPLSVVISAGTVLRAPGEFFVGRASGLAVVVAVLMSAGFYQVGLTVLGVISRRVSRWIDRRAARRAAMAAAGGEGSEAAAFVSRRRLLLGTKRAVVGGAVACAAYPVVGEPWRLSVTRRVFPIRGLPPELEGLRIVQLADIHHGAWMSVGRVRRIVDVANALEPDLVVLNGDYIQGHAAYAPPVAAELGRLRAKVGVVGVLGNHDWWLDGPLCNRELTRIGVRMIDNGRVFVTPGRELVADAGEGLCVAGVGDLWTDRQLYDRALGGVGEGTPRILVSHNPDVAEEPGLVTSGYRVDLMLSGHTHGGQVRLPIVGPPVTMSRYGRKYVGGLAQGPVCPVYVSRGLGMAVLPVRLGCVPEVAVIELGRG